MLSIRVGDSSYSVLFEVERPMLRLDTDGFEQIGHTFCAILNASNRTVASGRALRSAQDAPDDFVGMERALGRALVRFTKEERGKFWTAFWTAVKATEKPKPPANVLTFKGIPLRRDRTDEEQREINSLMRINQRCRATLSGEFCEGCENNKRRVREIQEAA